MPKPVKYQETVRESNRMMVLTLLKDVEMRFSELQDLSGLSPRGLAKILHELEQNGLVGRKLKERWPAYVITKKGMLLILNTMTLGLITDQIKKDGGKYFHDYSKIRPGLESKGMHWGIKDDIVIDKDLEKQLAPILQKLTKSMQSTLFDLFQSEMMDNVDPMKFFDKMILIGFAIDTTTLLKSIKESSFEILRESLNKKQHKNTRKENKRK